MVPGLVESNEILKNDIAQLRRRFKEDKGAAQKQIQMMESQGIYVCMYTSILLSYMHSMYVYMYTCMYVRSRASVNVCVWKLVNFLNQCMYVCNFQRGMWMP